VSRPTVIRWRDRYAAAGAHRGNNPLHRAHLAGDRPTRRMGVPEGNVPCIAESWSRRESAQAARFEEGCACRKWHDAP
jgi:hypothetical protein